MVTLIAKLTVKAGKEQEFEETMKKVVPEVRKEPGSRVYSMCRTSPCSRWRCGFRHWRSSAGGNC